MRSHRNTHHSPLAPLFGAAVLFLLLGFGNLFYGKHKLSSYGQQFLDEIATENPQPVQDDLSEEGQVESEKFQLFLNMEESDLERQRAEDRRRKISARLEFYEIVVIGGKCFLAFSGCLFLIFLIALRSGQRGSSSDSERP